VTLEAESLYDSYRRSTRQLGCKTDSSGHLYYDRPSEFVVAIPDGRVLGADFAVITADDWVIRDLSPEFESERYITGRHRTLSRLHLPSIHYEAGTVASLVTLGQEFYGHWLLDLLPRIQLLRDAGFGLADFDGFYLAPSSAPYQHEALSAIGLPLDRIIDPRDHRQIRANCLVVPSPVFGVYQASEYAIACVNNLFSIGAKEESPRRRRIYVSRASARHRRIINEDKLAEVLEVFDIEPVAIEGLTLRASAELFASCDVIVAPHGSGSANIAFCAPGAKVVDIQPPSLTQTFVLGLCAVRQLEYFWLRGDGESGATGGMNDDMTVDPDKLRRTLDLALG
jgi:capsular polysaccharide biosynthesis protein